MEIHSNEEICIVHYKDNKRVAVSFFNGHEERFALEEPMSRKQSQEFYETNKLTS
jgi:hypothetical protein